MGKTSTNAGIHPYRKTDFVRSIFYPEVVGKPLPKEEPKFVNTVISTEYKDSKNKELYFKDEVEYKGKKYEINYDTENFCWILRQDHNTISLKEAYKQVVLKKKCSARLQ